MINLAIPASERTDQPKPLVQPSVQPQPQLKPKSEPPKEPTEETWKSALNAVPKFIALAKMLSEINEAIEVVASDFNVSREELKQRWKEVANKSIEAIKAVARLPGVNSRILSNTFRIEMPTAAAYIAHASREKKKSGLQQQTKQPTSSGSRQPPPSALGPSASSTPSALQPPHGPPRPARGFGQLPPLPTPVPPKSIVSLETLTVMGKSRDVQHLHQVLLALQKSGQISGGLLIQR